MISEQELKEKLGSFIMPGLSRTIAGFNTIREVKINNGKAEILVASTALQDKVKTWMKGAFENAALKQDGIKEAIVTFIDMKPKEVNEIGNVIVVMSGKGGVGKSLISGLSAITLRRQGFEVGIMDADITGPSIPKMFGIKENPVGAESGMFPVLSKTGIEMMSVNLLLQDEEEPVIWRGPLIASAITQFWEEVTWGKLDYLIVDLPPGTADAPLTVLQKMPITGIIIVFSPQDLTAMVVRKAVNMAKHMDKKILGVVENMSYLYVPEIKKKINLFGKSKARDMAKNIDAPLLAQFPIDPNLAKLCDDGKVEDYNTPALNEYAKKLTRTLRGNK